MHSSQISVNGLAQACAHSAVAAEWSELLRQTTPLATLVAIRVARLWTTQPSAELIGEIVQEIYLKLCEHDRRILREFEPRGENSFLGLFRIVATSVANDYFRRLRSTKRGGKAVTAPLVPELAPPTSNGVSHSDPQFSILFTQLDRRLRAAGSAVSARDRNIFWLYYGQGFTAEEISAIPSVGLGAKGVESALRRIVLWLRAEIAPRRPAAEPAKTLRTNGLPKGAIPITPLNRE
jgi:RNA polymerase sigma-70 factor, ECF subfamily